MLPWKAFYSSLSYFSMWPFLMVTHRTSANYSDDKVSIMVFDAVLDPNKTNRLDKEKRL